MSLIPRARMDGIIAQSPDAAERIFSLMHEGSRLWVKRGNKNYLNNFQRLMGSLVSGPIHGPRIRLYREVTRIRALRGAGVYVPEIVSVGHDYIVLSDIGESLEALMRRHPLPAEATPYVQGAALALAAAHNKEQWHGNAKLRNFTRSEQGFGMIDFEDPVSPLPLPYKRLKDVFMFCGSSYRFDRSGTLIQVSLQAYRTQRRLNGTYVAALILLPLYLVLSLLNKGLGRDIQELLATLGGIYRFAVKR